MTNLRDTIALTFVTLLCGALTGCDAMSQPFPEKDFYAVEVGAAPSPVAKQHSAAVRVRRLRIAQPYDGRAFVYKVGPSKYKTDYYNSFIASPDQLLTSELTRWLSETKPFAAVVDSAGEAAHRYVLDGIVSELYGDYTDPQKPKAAIQAKSFLLDDSRAETAVQIVQLTSGEFSLLKIFIEHSERVLDRDTLLEITKGYNHSSIDRSIDVCVGRLRRKIEPDPTHPIYLRTIRGIGYLFSKEGMLYSS